MISLEDAIKKKTFAFIYKAHGAEVKKSKSKNNASRVPSEDFVRISESLKNKWFCVKIENAKKRSKK